jgi:hypothetical protein
MGEGVKAAIVWNKLREVVITEYANFLASCINFYAR